MLSHFIFCRRQLEGTQKRGRSTFQWKKSRLNREWHVMIKVITCQALTLNFTSSSLDSSNGLRPAGQRGNSDCDCSFLSWIPAHYSRPTTSLDAEDRKERTSQNQDTFLSRHRQRLATASSHERSGDLEAKVEH